MNNKKQTAVVVIPTYNEVDSIGKMIDHLFKKTFPQIKNWHCKLLVVDDTSPDGTYKVVQEKQKKYKDLYLLLNKEKAGIGNAYVKGFKEAMNKLDADTIIEFDSDFQHPPETIPAMLKEIENGADYVLGSRKIKGGSNPKGWGFKRVFFSEVGGFTARFILFFPFKNFFKITDPTTGLKASRVKGFVNKMDMDNLYTKSFAYKLEFLFKMVLLGAKIKEIPLQFGLRTVGESKIEPKTAADTLKTVLHVRLYDDPFVKKFLKFGTVGFIGYLVNATLLQLVANLGQPEWMAWGVSTEAAIISNFTLNNIWTFKSDKIKGLSALTKKFLQFNFTSAGALIIQTVVGTIGVSVFGAQYRQLLLPFIILFLVLPYNWIMYNKIIWKKK
ncbi:glycosyltransferase [Patescibacteria group bacterium]|nr:glycosyltransferase [Patescibacteria group bacterium]MBU1256582.1 glycosyltransferase [Patescibacteria group bacterium]MBU1457473.1 glycosyltransferase [Patescibacteria group bacterium]